ncbi:Putative 3,4-dihydroxy-2-butanone kinase [Melipona quadrifasciata]|uniref:Triokinase/FMN cyclase n=1 Tax=Melipona quadrifasciata TaxID=166423 RepID=A0A0N0U6N5_9HYME|nr:Putative 3,4-dihydroxy-2-butanone kinase [Melipona quadrifasciata]
MCESRKQEYYFDTIINKSLMGMARIHNGLIALEGCNAILRKDYTNMIGKVKLISGGTAEDELIYPGCVGPGMLTAAVLGNILSAPSVDNILRVIEEIGTNNTSGLLLIIQNCAEYSINFTLAKLHAELKGYVVKLMTINNNMSYLHFEYEKILSNIVKQLLEPLINILNMTSQDQTKTNMHRTKSFCVGHEIAILISNFGCSQIKKNIFILELLHQIEINGLTVKRIYMKEFMKNSNTSEFHICLLNLSLTEILTEYLDFPTSASTWPIAIKTKKNDETNLFTLRKHHKNIDCNVLNLQGPIMNYKTSQVFLSIISMACEAVLTCEKQLNKMDQKKYGNGEYGTNLARGAEAIKNAIQKNEILGTNLYVTFSQISHIIHKTVSGIQGGLYSLFFYYVAQAFSKYQRDQKITVNVWLHVLTTANKAIESFKVSSEGDQTLLTTLTAVQIDLQNALSKNVDPIDAFGIAVKAAESFTTNVLYGQYFYPHAHSVGIWMRAAYEGTKLKLIYYNTE